MIGFTALFSKVSLPLKGAGKITSLRRRTGRIALV